ncbi:DNA binding protein, partial [Tulasnella sp. 408]
GLFPEESLTDVHLRFRSEGERDVAYVVKQLSKDSTGDAKRMYDYIEKGICDAIEKQYLSSFVFAIYLDRNDPNNIIEAYTFNFSYHEVPGQEGRVPTMDLNVRMGDMSLGSDTDQQQNKEASAAPVGRSSLEVATNLRTLLRNISTRASMLYSLPRRRYATFKLYYTPETPEEYQPPGFTAVDPEDARLYFATHHSEEVPDREVYGTIETGYHSIDVKVATLTHCIPQTDLSAPAGRSDRKAEIAEQTQDAHDRNVVWSAEVDVQTLKDAKEPERVDPVIESSVDVGPIGTRARDGKVTLQKGGGLKTYVGAPSVRPADIQAFNDENSMQDVVETQPIEPAYSRPTTPVGQATSQMDTLQLADRIVQDIADMNDTEMLNADTQMPSIENNAIPEPEVRMEIDEDSLPRSKTPPIKSNLEPSSKTLRSGSTKKASPLIPCSCGGKSDKKEPEIVCNICHGVYHVWCAVLLEPYDCLVADMGSPAAWDEAKVEAENKWRALCLFRRALKIAKDGAVPQTALALSKRLGCPNSLGQQMKKRLEDEGFIGPEVIETVDVFEEPVPAKGKKKTKKPTKANKGKLVMFWSEVNKRKFMRYFKPGGTFERAIYNFNMGGAGMQSIVRALRSLQVIASQDQSQPKGPTTPKTRRKNSKTSTTAPYPPRQPLLPRQETTSVPAPGVTDHHGLSAAPRSPLGPTALLEDVFAPPLSARKRARSGGKVVTYGARKKLKMSMATGDLDMEE